MADHIRRNIVSGRLGRERQLPSLRRLAKLYRVSLPTMSAAIQILAAIGFVRVEHGIGTFVASPKRHAAVLNHALQNATVLELALMRSAIDEKAPIVAARAVKACAGRIPRWLTDLTFLARERSVHRDSFPEAFLRADLAFHRAMASAIPDAHALSAVHVRIGERLWTALVAASEAHAADEGLDAHHRALADAVLSGTEFAAARLARVISHAERRSLAESLG